MFKLYEVSNGKVKFANKAYLHIDNIFDIILNDEEGIIELNLENQSLNLNIIPKIFVNLKTIIDIPKLKQDSLIGW